MPSLQVPASHRSLRRSNSWQQWVLQSQWGRRAWRAVCANVSATGTLISWNSNLRKTWFRATHDDSGGSSRCARTWLSASPVGIKSCNATNPDLEPVKCHVSPLNSPHFPLTNKQSQFIITFVISYSSYFQLCLFFPRKPIIIIISPIFHPTKLLIFSVDHIIN